MGRKPSYETFIRTANQRHATNAELKKAIAHHQSDNLEKAKDGYQKILDIDPDHAEALHLLGLVAYESGSHEDAVRLIKKAIKKDTTNPLYYNNLGTALKEQGHPEEAVACYRKAIDLKGDFVEAHCNLGTVLQEQGRQKEAMGACKTALTLNPGYAPAHNSLAQCLYEQGETERALQHYREAMRLDPRFVEAMNNLAETLEKLNRLEEARAVVDAALSTEPGSYKANLNLATLEYRNGNFKAARHILSRLLHDDPSHRFSANAWSLLGLACDKLGEFETAFGAFVEANRRVLNADDAQRVGDESARQLASIGALREWFTQEKVADWGRRTSVDDLPTPVFLVGFPRSGTTLLDQILHAHSAVRTLEEKPTLTKMTTDFLDGKNRGENRLQALSHLTGKQIAFYRSDYWERVCRVLGTYDKGSVIVDKLPLNIVWLGLIYCFFPDAKVIVALRDPRDVALSNFMQLFQLNRSMYHFLSLEGTAAFYGAVMDLYHHYRSVLPLNRIEIRYEDLVHHTASELVRLIDFLGLNWEDGILEFHGAAKQRKITTPSYRQVVKPIYRQAVGRWRNYRKHLQPVLPELAPFVKAFGYDD